jgi:hypothetical protein
MGSGSSLNRCVGLTGSERERCLAQQSSTSGGSSVGGSGITGGTTGGTTGGSTSSGATGSGGTSGTAR